MSRSKLTILAVAFALLVVGAAVLPLSRADDKPPVDWEVEFVTGGGSSAKNAQKAAAFLTGLGERAKTAKVSIDPHDDNQRVLVWYIK
jgi:hypothetical protein